MKKLLIMLLLMTLLCGCKKEPEVVFPTVDLSTEVMEVYGDAQLLGAAASREEAENLAELYGITLVKFQNGLARFHTEEDPKEVIRRGKENGWPELTLNRTSKLF